MDYVIEEWDKDENDKLLQSTRVGDMFTNDNIQIEKYD